VQGKNQTKSKTREAKKITKHHTKVPTGMQQTLKTNRAEKFRHLVRQIQTVLYPMSDNVREI
jgi:hypothetical protein